MWNHNHYYRCVSCRAWLVATEYAVDHIYLADINFGSNVTNVGALLKEWPVHRFAGAWESAKSNNAASEPVGDGGGSSAGAVSSIAPAIAGSAVWTRDSIAGKGNILQASRQTRHAWKAAGLEKSTAGHIRKLQEQERPTKQQWIAAAASASSGAAAADGGPSWLNCSSKLPCIAIQHELPVSKKDPSGYWWELRNTSIATYTLQLQLKAFAAAD